MASQLLRALSENWVDSEDWFVFSSPVIEYHQHRPSKYQHDVKSCKCDRATYYGKAYSVQVAFWCVMSD